MRILSCCAFSQHTCCLSTPSKTSARFGFAQAARLDRQWLHTKRWGYCVLDEAHALKNIGSSRYKRRFAAPTCHAILPCDLLCGVEYQTFQLVLVRSPMHDSQVERICEVE
eukprot:423994-Pleurochrysis_carterae.AAC.2